MVPVLQTLIETHTSRPSLFAEPFCGGASVALRMLELKLVDHVVLADLDPLIANFWKTAAFDHEWLIRAMRKEPVTLKRWDYWRRSYPTSPRQRALKCLFLNRTTFSGILHGNAGPIGGRAQTSEHKIDCRFNKDALEEQIQTVAAHGTEGRILAVWNTDWKTAIDKARDLAGSLDDTETIVYLDPPYIQKATKLYKLAFTDAAHDDLASYLAEATDLSWILSYDDVPAVTNNYLGRDGVHAFRPTHHYTARGSRTAQEPGRELLFTNIPGAAPKT